MPRLYTPEMKEIIWKTPVTPVFTKAAQAYLKKKTYLCKKNQQLVTHKTNIYT